MLADNKIDKSIIFQILSDLQWHHIREFAHLARDVSPEIATRAYLRAVPKRDKKARLDADFHIKVKYGKLRMIDEVIRHLKRSGKIEIRGYGKNKEIRFVTKSNGQMTDNASMYCWSISVGTWTT